MTSAKLLVNDLPNLIHCCIKGDRQSQSQLYTQFAQKMLAVCLRYSKNKEEAEEILQEGFLKVFDHLDQFKFAGSFEGWMKKIMVNCALQRYRSKPPLRPVVDLDTVEIGNISSDDIIARLGAKELLIMVQQLPPVYKMVFNLYVFEGMKHREIGELLKISEGTSKSNLSDARRLLQKAVHKSLQHEPQKLSYL